MSDMKKKYIKPSTMNIELQYSTKLLTGSDGVISLQSTGWDNPEDALNLNREGGGNDILDR